VAARTGEPLKERAGLWNSFHHVWGDFRQGERGMKKAVKEVVRPARRRQTERGPNKSSLTKPLGETVL